MLFVRDEDGGLRSTGEERDAVFRGKVAGGRLYVLTNWEAPNWRVLELDPATLDLESARTVVAERDDAIVTEIALVGGRLVAHELEDASSRLRVYSLPDGELEREVDAPGPRLGAGHAEHAHARASPASGSATSCSSASPLSCARPRCSGATWPPAR